MDGALVLWSTSKVVCWTLSHDLDRPFKQPKFSDVWEKIITNCCIRALKLLTRAADS